MIAFGTAGVVFAFSLLATLLLAGPHDLSQGLYGFGNDPETFVWYLAWWPWAIGHGHDPFHSGLVFVPEGYSMEWGTSVPTASLLALPATLLWGPVVAFNLLTLAAHPLAATAMFLLGRELTGDVAASLPAGLLFGFSGYENGQVLGHLNLDLVFLVPLMVLVVVRRARLRVGRAAFILLLAFLLTAQFGLSMELFATAILSAAVAASCLAVADKGIRQALPGLALEAAASLLVVAVLVSPLLVDMARYARDVPGYVNPPSMYSNDIANLVVPTGAEALSSRLAASFTGNFEEQDLYLGAPLLLVLCLFSRVADRRGMALLATLAALVLLSLGPVLHLDGRTLPVPLPWALMAHVPLLRGALPCRLGLFVALTASVIAALWCADRTRRSRLWLGGLACLCLIPGLARASWTVVERPCLFTPAAIDASFGPDANLLVLPFGSGDSMLWQAVSGLRFRQSGGLLSFVPVDYQADPLTLALLRSQPGENFATELAAFAGRHGTQWVIAGPGTGGLLRAALADVGLPTRTICGVDVFGPLQSWGLGLRPSGVAGQRPSP